MANSRPRAAARTTQPPLQPDRYQQAVLDWVVNGSGNALVEAVPGSGKTTLLVQARRTYLGRAQFLAFARPIVSELQARGCQATTLHSFGQRAIRQRCPDSRFDRWKYWNLARQYWREQGRQFQDGDEFKQTVKHTVHLVEYCQHTLCDPHNLAALAETIRHFGLSVGPAERWQDPVAAVLAAGIRSLPQVMAYSDMVWAPAIAPQHFPLYQPDLLLIDEVQDFSTAKLRLALNARARRVLAVGDRRQSVYGFAGADCQSMSRAAAMLQAVSFPLSISYRLPTQHVRLANQVYPVIEAAPAARAGGVEDWDYSALPARLAPGDLVICRSLAPLAELLISLLARGIPASLVRAELGRELSELAADALGSDKLKLHYTTLFLALEEWFLGKRRELEAAGAPDLAVEYWHDRRETLQTLFIYWQHDLETVGDFRQRLIALCRSSHEGGVGLSTIHGAKGLEAARVVLLGPELLPHPKAELPWELEQERNLKFVAFTRSTDTLAFVTLPKRDD